MGDRRGLSHIEFVISFVIFIAFLVFAFVFFNPLASQRTLRSTSDYAWLEVSDAAKGGLESYSVSIAAGTPSLISIDMPSIASGSNATVEGRAGNIITSYTDMNSIVHFSKPSDNFVRIRYSTLIPGGSMITGSQLAQSQYTVSSSEVEEVYFERLLLELNRTYFAGYADLKKDFNLPNRVNFGFAVIFNDGSQILALNDMPEDAEVLSKEDHVKVMRSNGRLEFADVRVLVW